MFEGFAAGEEVGGLVDRAVAAEGLGGEEDDVVIVIVEGELVFVEVFSKVN